MGLLSTSAKIALETGPAYIASLVELDFTFGVERYWTGTHDLTYDGETYTAIGDMGKISAMESSTGLKANGLQLTLTVPHVDGEPAARFQNIQPGNYKNRSARTILGFFDETFTTTIHAVERRYFMDTVIHQLNPGQSSTVSISVESELMRGGKRSTKRLTDEQQRLEHSDDLGLQFLSYLSSGIEAKWGTGGAFYK